MAAARAHLDDVGMDKFSMGQLAKAAGVSRPALYLYFETREELLLSLFLDEAQNWGELLIGATPVGTTPMQFLGAFYDTAMSAPLFVQLAVRASESLEQKVTVDSLVDATEQYTALGVLIAEHVARVINVDKGKSIPLFTALVSLLVGTSQLILPPRLDYDQFAPELAETLAVLDPRQMFLQSGAWLLDGAR